MLTDTEFIKKLEYLALVAQRVFRGQLLARKRTRIQGNGIEFADHRDYVLGDDLRYLDWSIFARLGSRSVKRFEEEEDLYVYFFIDCSPSMAAGTSIRGETKLDYAKKIAAALAYIALSGLDRVSIISFSDGIQERFPLIRGKQNILRILYFLENIQISGSATNLKETVSEFFHSKPHTGLAIILSDLFNVNGLHNGQQWALDALRYRDFEPGVVLTYAPSEREPDVLGDIRLQESENGSMLNLTVSEKMQRLYRDKFDGFLRNVQNYCSKNGLNCLTTDMMLPFEETILRMMRESGMAK
ncbi:MAG: DUF58 domain-containing protein [Planctomycetaceae bacterium]|nr:DUF58 domain-containing protein [Planctomycetaceae bacterium]